MKLYDAANNRLVMLAREATAAYWDEHWQSDKFVEKIKAGEKNRFVRRQTSKVLRPGSKVIDGGCGIGVNVYGLRSWGYDAYGVDFAEKTIRRIKEAFPELNVAAQDVTRMDFPDGYFDGYWSIGLIEHFWDGYGGVLREASRLLKRGGYFFLTFPYLSPLRKFKIKLGVYGAFDNDQKAENFYQFLLDAERVKADVERQGFEFVRKRPFDATKGLKDEVRLLQPVLQKVYDSQSVFARGVRLLNSVLLSNFTAHSALLVFRKI